MPLKLTLGVLFGVLIGAWPTLALAKGVIPGTFSVNLHDTVPLLETDESPAEFKRVIEPSQLLNAPSLAQAGAHPDLSVTSAFRVSDINEVLNGKEVPSNIVFELPPGVTARLGSVPECKLSAFESLLYDNETPRCHPASQVGVVSVLFGGILQDRTYPLYKIYSFGRFAALAFPYELIATKVGIVLSANLRSNTDYGITLSFFKAIGYDGQFSSAFVPAPFMTLWGVPGDPAHDPERWDPGKQEWGASVAPPHPPLISSPSDCSSGVLEARLWMRYWFGPPQGWLPEDPEDFAYRSFVPEPTGCEMLTFDPRVQLSPSTRDSDSSTGVTLEIRLPRSQGSDLEIPPLKAGSLTLPRGMSVNPATANGLTGCTPEQLGGNDTSPAMPNPTWWLDVGEADCPDASKIGTLFAKTPLMESPVKGAIYFATPFENPFNSPLALYLVFEAPGFSMRLPARVDVNPETGQLTATVSSLPQLPFEDLTVHLFDGPRAPLSTPQDCGVTWAKSLLVPWSAPHSGQPVSIESALEFLAAPGGTSCPNRLSPRPFAPVLLAGAKDPLAAAPSSFILRVRRPDGDQELKSIAVKLPRGLIASLQGGSYCSDADIARAEARNGLGEGIFEQNRPSCPEASRAGSLLVGMGTGSIPLYSKGTLYLAGPYKGAPFSLVAITPGVAGGTEQRPLFDVGAIVLRVALDVDPRTAQITARSNVIPRALDGVPLRIKDLRLVVDRPGLLRNSSSCEEMKVVAAIDGWDGGQASLVNRFQLDGCRHLGFRPRLSVQVAGGGHLGQHPTLQAVLKARLGDAGISRMRITLPKSLYLDRTRARDLCPEPQLVERSCPLQSIYGQATVWSPLLGQPLRGPVYLTPTAGGLPNLVLALEGQFRLDVVGKMSLRRHRIQVAFVGLPDVPLSKLVMSFHGARKGFLVNGRDLCGRRSFYAARFTARNGRVENQRSVLGSSCRARRSPRIAIAK